MTADKRYVLAIRTVGVDRAPLIGLEALAAEAGLHPEVVRRLVALGALDRQGGTSLAPMFPRDAAARLARIGRLRRDLGLSYAGAVLACHLIARIEILEDLLARPDSSDRKA